MGVADRRDRTLLLYHGSLEAAYALADVIWERFLGFEPGAFTSWLAENELRHSEAYDRCMDRIAKQGSGNR